MTCTTQSVLTKNDWKDDIRAGDIVIYAWPLIDPAPGERLKPRPTLVRAIRDIDGVRHAELVFGTGSLRRRGPHDVILADPEDLNQAGIRKATRFEDSRRMVVPLGDPGFAVSAALNSAIIGTMPDPVARPRGFHLCRRRPRNRAGTHSTQPYAPRA